MSLLSGWAAFLIAGYAALFLLAGDSPSIIHQLVWYVFWRGTLLGLICGIVVARIGTSRSESRTPTARIVTMNVVLAVFFGIYLFLWIGPSLFA